MPPTARTRTEGRLNACRRHGPPGRYQIVTFSPTKETSWRAAQTVSKVINACSSLVAPRSSRNRRSKINGMGSHPTIINVLDNARVIISGPP